MAESYEERRAAERPLSSEIDAAMGRLQIGADAQWQALGDRWNGIFRDAQRDMENVPWYATYEYHRPDMPETEAYRQGFYHALGNIEYDRDYRDYAKTPAFQQEQRDAYLSDLAADRAADPDYLGQLAEERFYQEQDPASPWYRNDLYHRQMGPDVQDLFDDIQTRLDHLTDTAAQRGQQQGMGY